MNVALGAALVSAALVAPGTASVAAQEASPAAAEQPADPFAGVTIAPLGSIAPSVAADHALSVIRLTLEPGAEIPAHYHPGAVVLRVEEGAFGTTFVEGEGQITRASADGTPIAESVAAGDDLVLQAGDVLTYEGAIHTMRNAGDEPLVLLASVLLAADQPAFIFQQGTPTP
jgi:quercetin dioxygenase-like cupin family protein